MLSHRREVVCRQSIFQTGYLIRFIGNTGKKSDSVEIYLIET